MVDQKTDHLDQIYEEFIDKQATDKYLPNPLESYENFKKKQKVIMKENSTRLIENVMDGLVLFLLVDGSNERTASLIEKFLSLETNPAFQNKETLLKTMKDQNIFGLTEEDFKKFLSKSDLAYEKGFFTEASTMYQTLIFLFPTHIESWLRWGHLEYEHFFDYPKVLKIYQQCLESFDHPIVYLAMGLCHIKGQDFLQAETCFNKVVELCEHLNEPELKQQAVDMLAGIK